jgi:hypothetical protein
LLQSCRHENIILFFPDAYKKTEDIHYKLIGELVSEITPEEWIEMYETNYKDHRKRNWL